MEAFVVVDVFFRHTDHGGRSWVTAHRAHDKERFIDSMVSNAARVAAEKKDSQMKCEQITEDQYRKERTK